jgi:hypothetical protein
MKGKTSPLGTLVGSVYYRERFSVAEIGGRWYLTSPYWSGEAERVVKAEAAPQ